MNIDMLSLIDAIAQSGFIHAMTTRNCSVTTDIFTSNVLNETFLVYMYVCLPGLPRYTLMEYIAR